VISASLKNDSKLRDVEQIQTVGSLLAEQL
jgi:hypothetical protein